MEDVLRGELVEFLQNELTEEIDRGEEDGDLAADILTNITAVATEREMRILENLMRERYGMTLRQ